MELSEEEKKAIEYLKEERAFAHKFDNRKIITICTIALNLIEKLQKEIEEYKRYGYTTQILSPVTVKLNYIPIKNVLDMLDELEDRRDKGHITGYYSKREMLKKLLKQVNFDYKKYKQERKLKK